MRKIVANYSIGETIENALAFLYTRFFWPKARLIRKGTHIRGRKGFVYGKNFTTGYGCRIDISGIITEPQLIIGKNFVMGDYCTIAANKKVTIGDNVLLGSRVFITDTSHGKYKGSIDEQKESIPEIAPNERPLYYDEIKICDNVWIGQNVTILPGVTIGEGSIIGANSVVTKSIPKNTISAGSPTNVIKEFKGEKWIIKN